METFTIYSTCLGIFLTLAIGWELARQALRWRQAAFIWARGIASRAPVRQRGAADFSVMDGTQVLILVIGNILACWCRSRFPLATRLAHVALVNMSPLFLGHRSVCICDLLGLSLHWRGLMHRWVGRTMLLQAVAHAMIHLVQQRWRFASSQLVQIILISIVGSIVLSTIFYVRRRFFELFLKFHSLSVLCFNILLWCHISIGRNFPTFALAIATGIWVLNLLLMSFYMYADVLHVESCAVEVFGNVTRVKITLRDRYPARRRWGHGQFVYLTLPSSQDRLLEGLQAHPYQIMWAESQSLTLLIDRHYGFSNRLREYTRPAIRLCGPYGRAPRLENYDTVLCISSGVGIAAHLLTIRHLLEMHTDMRARVRRLTLIWRADSPSQEACATEEIIKLWNQSNMRQIFTVSLYGQRARSSLSKALQKDPRTAKYTPLLVVNDAKIGARIEAEWSAEAGNMAILLCGSPIMEANVRKSVRSLHGDITIITSAFRLDVARDRSNNKEQELYEIRDDEMQVEEGSAMQDRPARKGRAGRQSLAR